MSVAAKGAQAGSVDLLERWAIPLALASAALANFAWLALLSGNAVIAACIGVPALMCLMAIPSGSEPTAPGRCGEIARMSHEEFDRLIEEVETLAAAQPARFTEEGDEFEQLVREAVDELPDYLQATLDDNVAVVVSDDGAKRGWYGLYHGGTAVYSRDFRHTIVIYRDTLVRDFGYDPEELRRQVARTVRHEVAHHLGATERHVAELGL